MGARHFVLSSLVLSVLLPAASAAVLHVPASYPTIQLAVNAAGSGDTILVAPGHYAERIDLLGKKLKLQSEDGAAVTTIDGGGLGPVVRANTAEPAGTALRGFTITGGNTGEVVVIVDQGGPYTAVYGGGVFIGTSAHLDVVDCVLSGNALADPQWPTLGGALAVSNGSALLLGCTVSGNSAEKVAALFCRGSPFRIVDCTVSNNSLTSGTQGAAISVVDGRLVAANCRVQDNQCTGLSSSSAFGFGPYIGCSFSGNAGWGCTLYGPAGTDMYDCQFFGNALGGASLLSSIQPEHILKRCVFANGDGVKASGSVTADACVFDGTHVQVSKFDHVTVTNSIVRTTAPFVQGSLFPVSFKYSDVQGGAAGTGNIDADPQWVNPAAHDYGLLATSPCLDAADPAALLDPDHTRADMGPAPVASWASLGGGISAFAYVHPRLAGQGALLAGQPIGMRLDQLPASQAVALFVGLDELRQTFKGGVFWPVPQFVVPGLVTDGAGNLWLTGTWPAGVPSGTTLELQAWFASGAAVQGAGATNGVRVVAP